MKGTYERLLNSMINASRYLDQSLTQIDSMKSHLKEGLRVNSKTYKLDYINDKRDNIISQKNTINGVIIPGIRSIIARIEAEEAAEARAKAANG